MSQTSGIIWYQNPQTAYLPLIRRSSESVYVVRWLLAQNVGSTKRCCWKTPRMRSSWFIQKKFRVLVDRRREAVWRNRENDVTCVTNLVFYRVTRLSRWLVDFAKPEDWDNIMLMNNGSFHTYVFGLIIIRWIMSIKIISGPLPCLFCLSEELHPCICVSVCIYM